MQENSSPAQAYAAFRARQAEGSTVLHRFRDDLPYPLDDFQIRACRALEEGRSVLVAAPTGAGKTTVAQFGVELAVARDVRVFYTTPIKALSNQKYQELVDAHGADRVGLLTGDASINRDAQIVVMTTEVLRNMIYSGTGLDDLGYVVLDEVHYLGDRFRGPVWEEVIIHLPAHVLLVSLSATVSNAEEFGAWLAEVRGHTDVIVSEHRPVPLYNHVAVGTDILPLFTPTGHDVNRDLQAAVRRYRGSGSRRDKRRHSAPRFTRPARSATIRSLARSGLLPAIYFIFSRNACDDAVEHCLASGLDLTDEASKRVIREELDDLHDELPDADLSILGFHNFAAGLLGGFGAHHAGLIPQFKELVERLYAAGHIKVVFATETLALGINMPARSVVLEKLSKFNGETHVQITPGEYTQLTGRAGRRGIDVEGHAVTIWHPSIDPSDIAALASKRTYALKSQFTPTYNMAANLLARLTTDDARKVLETSFAQYQADTSVVGLAKKARRADAALEKYHAAMQCDHGDFAEYFGLRRTIAAMEKSAGKSRARLKQRELLEAMSKLRFGDVVLLPSRRSFGACTVIAPLRTEEGGDTRLPSVLTSTGKVWHLRPHEVTEPPVHLGHIKPGKKFNHRVVAERRRVVETVAAGIESGAINDPADVGHAVKVRADTVGREQIEAVRAQLRAHPCHACPDRETHARWAERAVKLEREQQSVMAQITGRTESIAHVFDRVCNVLTTLKFLPDDSHILRRIYGERDLLTALSVRAGLWDELDEPECAALASMLVYQARRETIGAPRLPSAKLSRCFDELRSTWRMLSQMETDARLPVTPEPEAGIARAMYNWANGKDLAHSIGRSEVAAGDFVRWARQTLDLLGQVEQVAIGRTAAVIRRAAESLRRGVVLD
ncbi:DEAD/DEAH box helicase [Brevibacterium sp. 50QC2O2]|uniref:DEAD/DEAH box helicase n=1 Tax=Brevibacterium sp. 50QC2O2 TaxID=2968459 RepID=UPI00211BE986|nr:DEAD/DEAH box helicase [Brevibacterium sp. 50QC2O2]MCQ9388837.1 DEAD/DEAH box helicase [Brevibacterium sp. 50QC2O2]